jgi:hypothetical protein
MPASAKCTHWGISSCPGSNPHDVCAVLRLVSIQHLYQVSLTIIDYTIVYRQMLLYRARQIPAGESLFDPQDLYMSYPLVIEAIQ